jgi:hypothetical protein
MLGAALVLTAPDVPMRRGQEFLALGGINDAEPLVWQT